MAADVGYQWPKVRSCWIEKLNTDPKRTTWNYSLRPYQQYSCLFGLANVFSMFGDSIPVFESVHDQGYVSKSNQGHAVRAGLGAANSTCIWMDSSWISTNTSCSYIRTNAIETNYSSKVLPTMSRSGVGTVCGGHSDDATSCYLQLMEILLFHGNHLQILFSSAHIFSGVIFSSTAWIRHQNRSKTFSLSSVFTTLWLLHVLWSLIAWQATFKSEASRLWHWILEQIKSI
jgi:hypothetical protein